MYRGTFREYKIEIIDEQDNDVDSADNKFNYDLIYRHSEDPIYAPTSKHGIKIYKEGLYKSAIVWATGGATGVASDSAIIDEENLLLCCCNKVFCLRLPDLELDWVIEADMATCFGIYQYKDSYIVHGELAISRISQNGKIQWKNGASDIFVNIDHQGATFQMQDEYIELMDWNGFRYKLFYDGKIVDDGMAPLLE